jgi:hypothetical protein
MNEFPKLSSEVRQILIRYFQQEMKDIVELDSAENKIWYSKRDTANCGMWQMCDMIIDQLKFQDNADKMTVNQGFNIISATSTAYTGIATMNINPKTSICVSVSLLTDILNAINQTGNYDIMLSIYTNTNLTAGVLGFHLPLNYNIKDDAVPIVICAGRYNAGYSDSLINQKRFCDIIGKELGMRKRR